MTRIAIFSFGNFGKFFRHVIDYSRNQNMDVEWSILANNYQAVTHYNGVIDPRDIKYLFENFNQVYDSMELESYADIVKNYNPESSIWRALVVDKVHYKQQIKEFQIRHALTVYKINKQFLMELKPEYVLFPIIESHDGFILYDLCKELNIKPIIYGHARNIGGSFFTDSHMDYLPLYTDVLPISDNIRCKAIDFVRNFRVNYKSVHYSMNQPQEVKILECQQDPPTLERLMHNISASLGKEKHNLKIDFWIKFLVYFQKYNHRFRKFKYKLQQGAFDINSSQGLPERYIYFPLQFSPEASINVPNPYYIDQMRVIDEIILKYSRGRYVLVKEHPAMMGARPTAFYDDLKRKPGVLTCNALIPSQELIFNADLTVSVTGTATLEAYLLGKPCLLLGDNLLKPYLDNRLEEPYDDEEIISFVSKVMACTNNFILYSPGAYGLKQADLFNYENVKNFTEHLLWHINKTELLRV